MPRTIRLVVSLLLLSALACGAGGGIRSPLGSGGAPTAPVALDVTSGAARQLQLQAEAEAIQVRFTELRRRGGWRERGYFSASEHDDIEWLVFRFVTNHAAFWGEIDRLGGAELALVGDEVKPQAHLLGLHAGLALADSSAFLVTEFADDGIAKRKLNEAFYRTEIPAGTYDRLALAVTERHRRQALATAWALHEKELVDPAGSAVAEAASDPALAPVLAALPPLRAHTAKRLAALDAEDGAVEARLDHSPVAAAGRDSARGLEAFGYQTRALLFKDVSRVKSPTAHPIVFSAEQKRQLHGLLRPGDLILTYTAGYVSDVFIPGEFKHGITYVGTGDERTAAGLSAASAPKLARPRNERFAADVARDHMPDGSDADLIEAVAEGVKFSNLDTILDTHINRLVVLRPRINAGERTEFLAGVFAFVGDPYDFRFDFSDATRQVCTEVIYRALNGKGGIEFSLTPRGGHPTLSADDVVLYHLAEPGRFEVIAFAEEDPERSDQAARLQVGTAAERRLAQQMDAQ